MNGDPNFKTPLQSSQYHPTKYDDLPCFYNGNPLKTQCCVTYFLRRFGVSSPGPHSSVIDLETSGSLGYDSDSI